MKRLTKIFAAICAIAMVMSAGTFTADAKKKEEKAKYIFLFIGDGMGLSHVAAAESYLSYKDGRLGGTQLTMTQFPYFGTATSYSANSYVTDSSAAGTAIACGEKANNYTLGVDAEGNPVKSMAFDLKEEGYQIAIMSNVPINHATPGAFYANNMSRSAYYDISRQIADTDFEFFAGSGFLEPKGKKGDMSPVDKYLEEKGYEVSYGVEEFKKESAGRENVIFCQESSKEKDPNNYVTEKIAEDIPLVQMLELGMEHLDTDKPFFIACEGGNIDWGGHSNQTMATVYEIIGFDNAIKLAYEFYMKHPKETLIVVTADHETGGISLGAGPEYIDWPLLEKTWEENAGKELGRRENAELNRKASIGWTTGSHTGAPVPVFAVGKGAEKFSGRMDNTDIKGKILNKAK